MVIPHGEPNAGLSFDGVVVVVVAAFRCRDKPPTLSKETKKGERWNIERYGWLKGLYILRSRITWSFDRYLALMAASKRR